MKNWIVFSGSKKNHGSWDLTKDCITASRLLICTLLSENQSLEKLSSYSNLRKFSGPANLDFFSVCHLDFFQVFQFLKYIPYFLKACQVAKMLILDKIVPKSALNILCGRIRLTVCFHGNCIFFGPILRPDWITNMQTSCRKKNVEI